VTTSRPPPVHDLSVSVNGNVTALSAHSGDMGSALTGESNAQGVYVDDRRVVSVLTVLVGTEPAELLSTVSSGERSDFFSRARLPADLGADPTVEICRRRLVRVQGIAESVEITSRGKAEVETDLFLHVGGDGAPIAQVKSGILPELLLGAEIRDVDLLDAELLNAELLNAEVLDAELLGAERGRDIPGGSISVALSWRDQWHRTEVSFDPAPTSVVAGVPGEASTATFHLSIAPGQTVAVVITIEASRLRESCFDADPGADRVDWSGVSVRSADPRLEPTVKAGLDDLLHLLLTDPQEPSSVFAAAGTPWYLTLFGRDSLWAARMALPFGTELAAGTLRALARRQGTTHDEVSAQAPGKIPHEVRRTHYVDPSAGLALPPVYYGTIDATPLWVTLLRDAWRWGLEDRQVEALLPSLRAATRWLTDDAAPDPDGLLKYLETSGKGLANQGWKDSPDAIRWCDGRIADAPIALCEAQAYAIEAATAAVELFTYFNVAGAGEMGEYAANLRTRFRDYFWVGPPGQEIIGLAVDGHGQTVDAVGSNMGHVLGTGTLDASEVDRVARTLTSPQLLSRFGIRTLAGDTTGFNPNGYHTGSIWTHDTAIGAWGLAREGRRDEATAVARTLLTAAEAFDYRLPELYADVGVGGPCRRDRPVPYPASCRPQAWSAASAAALVSVALGFDPDAPAGRLILRPARPAAYGEMSVVGLRFAGRSFGVRCQPDGAAELVNAPDDVDIVIR
jgi:glycogen debranching enzyme